MLDFTHEGIPYRIDLAALAVLVEMDGVWVPLRNLDLRADILRALNDGYGPEGD